MKAKIVFLARVKDESKEKTPYPFLPVEAKAGRPVPIPGASCYYVRAPAWVFGGSGSKRMVKSVGPNLDIAFVAYLNHQQNFARSHAGMPPVHGAAGLIQDFKDNAPDRVRISDTVEKYLAELAQEVETGEKAPATRQAYTYAVKTFQDNCAANGVEYLDEITREVLKAHKFYLFKEIKERPKGKHVNSVSNHFRYLSVFLNSQGIQMVKDKRNRRGDQGLLDRRDVPKSEEKDSVNEYSDEEINAMLAVSSIDEADFIHCLVRTGIRRQELAHLHWTDFDFRRQQVTISEKPKYGWKTKNRRPRVIKLRDGVLLPRIAARHLRYPDGDLVFPNSINQPDQHLIKRLQTIVAKASAKGFTFEGDVDMHRFRRTFISRMSRVPGLDVKTLSRLVGHANVKTTALYMAPSDSMAETASQTAFKGLGD